MAVMGVFAFDENKRKDHETIPSRFCFTPSVSSTRDKLSIHLVTESVHLTVILGISKTMALATMSQQAHAC